MGLEQKLKKWNPWWTYGEVPQNLVGISREQILSGLLKLIPAKETLVLCGVRRSGKSTLLYQIIQNLISKKIPTHNILYFNLDEPLPDEGITNLENIYSTYLEMQNPSGRLYLFFDEIQNIPNWHKWVKSLYDLKGKEVKFIITGSNHTLLNTTLSTLLTGRILIESIYPLSFQEYLLFQKHPIGDFDLEKEKINHQLNIYWKRGGFPEAVLESDPFVHQKRLQDYFDSILFRDVLTLHKIREGSKLRDLAFFAITNIGNLASYSKIERTIGLNINSIREYLSCLENAYLIFETSFFSYSVKESIAIQKPRKLYCIDHGLRNVAGHLFSEDRGRVAENIVFLELKRRNKEISYWKNKNEIDFVIKNKDHSCDLINVSFSDQPPVRETKGFDEFIHMHPSHSKVRRKIIVTHQLEKKETEIRYIPLYKFLLSDEGAF